MWPDPVVPRAAVAAIARGPILIASFAISAALADTPPSRPLLPLKSGVEFQSADVRQMQADDFGNPGMLWVARGEALWREGCSSCHQDAAVSMRGAAVRYPRHDATLGGVVDLEQR